MWVPTAKSPTLQSKPSSLGLFSIPSYEKISSGKRISSDEEVKEAVTTWFEEQLKDFFSRGIKSLQQKWAKCIELLGTTLKNEKHFFVVSCFFLTQVDKLLNAPRILHFAFVIFIFLFRQRHSAPYNTEGLANRASSKVRVIQMASHRNLSLKLDFLAIIS